MLNKAQDQMHHNAGAMADKIMLAYDKEHMNPPLLQDVLWRERASLLVNAGALAASEEAGACSEWKARKSMFLKHISSLGMVWNSVCSADKDDRVMRSGYDYLSSVPSLSSQYLMIALGDEKTPSFSSLAQDYHDRTLSKITAILSRQSGHESSIFGSFT